MKSEYFSFRELLNPLYDLKVSNYSGWSGLEVFKFYVPKGKSLTNSIINEYKPDLIDKEKILL